MTSTDAIACISDTIVRIETQADCLRREAAALTLKAQAMYVDVVALRSFMADMASFVTDDSEATVR